MNNKPMLAVAAVTKHFPKKRTKSPTPFITATWTALLTIVVNAYKNQKNKKILVLVL